MDVPCEKPVKRTYKGRFQDFYHGVGMCLRNRKPHTWSLYFRESFSTPLNLFHHTGIMNVTAVQPNKCRFFLKILGFTIFFSSAGFPFKLVGMRDANL